jgi:hypothetical protein
MDDRPVSVDRLEVIGSGSGERLYSAMREQAERRRDFQRRVRWMWLRRELVVRPEHGPVLDVCERMSLISTEALEEPHREHSA